MLFAGVRRVAATVPLTRPSRVRRRVRSEHTRRLQGKVVRVEWVNPHAWIHLEIAKPDGDEEVWMVEGGTPNTLLRRGLTGSLLKLGRDGRHRADRRRVSDQGSLAQARERPRRDIYRRSQVVHGIVGHRRSDDGRDPTEKPKKPPGRLERVPEGRGSSWVHRFISSWFGTPRTLQPPNGEWNRWPGA